MKRKFIIILAIIILAIISCYIYIAYRNQENKHEKIICDCRLKGIYITKDFATFSLNKEKIDVIFAGRKIEYVKKSYGKGFILSIEMLFNKSIKDTLFIKDNSKTIKIYDFDVDTLIINKKQGIICDLKELTVNGKKQSAKNLIILD